VRRKNGCPDDSGVRTPGQRGRELEFPLCLGGVSGLGSSIPGRNRCSEGETLGGRLGQTYTAPDTATPPQKPAFPAVCLPAVAGSLTKQGELQGREAFAPDPQPWHRPLLGPRFPATRLLPLCKNG
jgi:hypothetical protein